jgi:hypothetical protein
MTLTTLLLLLAQFFCPMHPDQRSETPSRCPVCTMPMVPVPPARFDTYPVDLRVTATTGGARLRIAVVNPRSRTTVRRFTIVHERSLHLFVVGGDLTFVAHEHPVQQPDGVFMIDVALPKTGAYMAIAEFLPEGGTPQMVQRMFTTGEAFPHSALPAVDVAPKAVGGMRVSADFSRLKAGEVSPIAFRVDDAVSGAPAPLEPYLGAAAHLLIVSDDLTEAIHGHPNEQFRDPGVTFMPLIPRAGRYKAWIQFQRAGAVSTASFVFEVQ